MRRCFFFFAAVFAVIVGLFPSVAVSDTIPAAKRLPATNIPQLLVTDGAKRRPLALTGADIAVDIAGYLAQTTMTLTFSNNTDRILEGELVFPLPEGVTISGYCLDVNGTIVDGVPVENQAARIIFEKEVRKGVDPGLVEQTVGNVFRTRVYPIPARGSRTLRLRWAEALETNPATGRATYTLRQRTENALSKLTLRVSALHPPGVPQTGMHGASLSAPPIRFVPAEGGSVAAQTLINTPLNGNFTLAFAPPANAGPIVAVEPFTRASATHPETFFTVTDRVPNAPANQLRMIRSVQRIGIVWDASLSRRGADTARECRILAALLHHWSSLDVEVTLLRDKAETPRRFSIHGGDSRALIAFLRSVPCDGGTNLSALNLARHNPRGARDLWLLFTDGLSNLGASEMPNINGSVPIYAFASDVRANHALLRLLCERTRGAYLNLDRFPRDADVVERVISPSPFSLVSMTVFPRNAASGLYASASTVVSPRGRLTVAGKLLAAQATITLAYGFDKANIIARRTIVVRRANAPHRSSGLMGRFWAQRKAEALSPLPTTNHDALTTLGQDFGIVTPGTSLLVLETLQQHLDYHIAPARSRASLYDAYLGHQQQAAKTKRQQESSRLAEVSEAWKERVHWWSTPVHHQPQTAKREGDVRPRTDAGIRITGRPVSGTLSGQIQNGVVRTESYGAGAAPRAGFAAPVRMASSANLDTETLSLASKKSKSDADDRSNQTGPEITIQPWSPKMPYMNAMRAAGTSRAYAVYLAQRPRYLTSPAFYLDCAEFLLQRGQTERGLRVLTNVAELGLEDPQLLRIVAHRLAQAGRRDLAIAEFERIRTLRPEEPQSLRDLALVLIDRADDRAASSDATVRRQAVDDYNRGLALLYQVVAKRWDRFDGIEEIALMEVGRTVARAKWTLPAAERNRLIVPFPASLVKNLSCGTRILMTWDTDETDMDLWVTEPTGEKCFYSNNRTAIGGRLSNDFTQGYGPEEYLLRRNLPGKYRIQSNYYGTHQQKLTGGTTVQATVITDWGKPTEQRRYLTLRLTTAKETVEIGTVVQKNTVPQ